MRRAMWLFTYGLAIMEDKKAITEMSDIGPSRSGERLRVFYYYHCPLSLSRTNARRVEMVLS